MYGTVEINGKTYMEREQTFPFELPVTANNQLQRPTLALPGTADFWLKTLTRTVVVNGAEAQRRFKFRLGNSDGGTWYQSGGNGGTTDLVIDTLLFGDAKFPFVLTPFIFYGASSSIQMTVEDISADAPYTIYFAFRGSYLIPV